MIGAILKELSAGARRLAGAPGYSLIVVLTLALGIGANLTTLSAVRSLLLDPLSYTDSNRIVTFWSPGDWSLSEFEFAAERVRGYEDLAAIISPVELTLARDGEARLLKGAGVTGSYFDVLGALPARGRALEERDTAPGTGRVVVLSWGLWTELGEPEVGKDALQLSGEPHVVVGVMPRGFEAPLGRSRLWIPETLDPAHESYRLDHSYQLLGRLADSTSLALAKANANELGEALSETYQYPPDYDKSKGATVQLLRDQVVGDLRGSLLAVWLTVALVLLIACANVSSLQLVRAMVQRRQLAIRRALGARPRRLVGHVLAEALLLGLGAGVAGFVLGGLGVRLLPQFLPEQVTRLQPLEYGVDMVPATIGFALAAGILLGALPALRAARPGNDLLGGRGTGSRSRSRRLERALVLCEIALGVVVVFGATLISQHVLELRSVEPGFQVDGVTSFRLQVPSALETAAEAMAFVDRVERAVAALPEVQSVGAIQRLPLQEGWTMNLSVEGADPEHSSAEAQETVAVRMATAGYFDVAAIAPTEGRLIEIRDDAAAADVALVNEELARRFFSDRDPLGRRVKTPIGEWVRVVGVVPDERIFGLDRAAPPILYLPYAQQPLPRTMSFVIAATSPLESLTPAIREAIADVDPTVAPGDFAAMTDRLAQTLTRQRTLGLLLSAMALVALLLGGLGLSGLLSSTVLERRQEIGIRLALGARPSGVLGRIGAEAMALCTVGLVGGVLLSWLLKPTAESWLGLLGEINVGVGLVIVGALLLTGLAAATLPMVRAGRVDPVRVLERR